MSRGATRRRWVKLFITGWLHGSVRWQLTPEQRGTFADLICLAGECGKDGAICDNDNRPFPREFIANQLNIPLQLLEETIKECRDEGRIEDRDDVIVIKNWDTYQSEYERQSQYRKKGVEDPDKYKEQKYGHMVQR
jgi:hypothetical protein